MRTLLILIGALTCATPTAAADLTCTVPVAAVPRAQELCEIVRLRYRVRAADWSNDSCATELLRIGIIEVERRAASAVAKEATETIIKDAVTLYMESHPTALVSAYCGDGITDVEFGEECDDGNTEPDDGCSPMCETE